MKSAKKKIYKRVRFDVDPLLDKDSEISELDIENEDVFESEVIEEDPLDASQDRVSESFVLTEREFWEYVYSHTWSGRLRIFEGNLLKTLIRVFDNLILSRRLGSVESTQYHEAIHLRGRIRNMLFEGKKKFKTNATNITQKLKHQNRHREVKMDDYWASCKRTKYGGVKVVLTFYGGKPMGRRQRVTFDTRAAVDTSPRLTRLFPIIKGSRMAERRGAIFETEKERENVTRALEEINADKLKFFAARTPADFTARCLQAADDFIIVKEQVLYSKDWKIRTNFTISRKVDSRYGLFRLSTMLPRFYETKTMAIC